MLHDFVKNGLTLAAILFAIATLLFASTPSNTSAPTKEAATQLNATSSQDLAVK